MNKNIRLKKPKKESNKRMFSYQILKHSRRQQWKEWVAETEYSVHKNINSRNRSSICKNLALIRFIFHIIRERIDNFITGIGITRHTFEKNKVRYPYIFHENGLD